MYRAGWALCGSREDAEDLVQETFARVLSRPRVIRGDERGYLMRALRNTFYSRLRTASRRPVTVAPTGAEAIGPPDTSTARRPDAAAEVSELLAAVSALPEDFRLAIVAVDILGLSYAEAARALETSEATITSRLYRARGRVVKAVSAPSGEETGPKRSLA